MSIITKMIVKADAETRYPTPGEIEEMKGFIMSGERRLRIVQALSGNRQRIVQQAGEQLFQKQPRLVSPGGNAYGKEMTATCLRDLDYYLRLLTYSIAAGETSPIQDIGIIGVREMYGSLGTPIESVAEGIRVMKRIVTPLLSGEDSGEVSFYFDYLIGALQ